MSNPDGILTIAAASPIPIIWLGCTGVEFRRSLAPGRRRYDLQRHRCSNYHSRDYPRFAGTVADKAFRFGQPAIMARRPDQLAIELNNHRNAFKAFLTARVGSEAEAEDILQNGLLKALKRSGELQDEAKLTAWFYQLLRNAVVDHYRAQSTAKRGHDELGRMLAGLGEDIAAAPKGWESQVCGCLAGVVETLKPQHAELLRRVDLNGDSVQIAAKALKMTANNASVILHRARRELRTRLETFCGDCADGACLDCDCPPSSTR